MTTKFIIFLRLIISKPEKVTKVTQAVCALHNYLKISEMHSPPSTRIYCPPVCIDCEDLQGNVTLGDWRAHDSNGLHPISQVGSNRYSRSAAEMCDTLMTYFNSS